MRQAQWKNRLWHSLLLLQVLRLSEELLSGAVLDDSCMAVIARGCKQLQELELVQVCGVCYKACCLHNSRGSQTCEPSPTKH
jgi:hypothetical protein